MSSQSEAARSRLEPAEPHLFVVLGGSGDLMRTKLLPALWHLGQEGWLGEKSVIAAAARRAHLNDISYRDWAREALAASGLRLNDETDRWCANCLHYHSLGQETMDDFVALVRRLEQIEAEHDLPGNRVFYLAIPPAAVAMAVERLGQVGLHKGPGWTRLVIEKPFGHDLESAHELDRITKQYFDESQIYRIDHYLGKEAVQNLMVFRFANSIFHSVWDRNQIASVQITVGESAGVRDRGGYYDGVGAIRDMVQNHLTQLLALTAMEIPSAFEADAIRDEKAKVLRSIRRIDSHNVVLGQYTAGTVNGKPMPAYREAAGVAPDSNTATFAALEVLIDNWRWQGVPFFLRTGKSLPVSVRQIIVNFRCPILALFERFPEAEVSPNALVITIEPDEGFELSFSVKTPGEMLTLQTQRLKYRYAESFGRLPEAYEALLLDVLKGDQTLFVRIDEVLEAWRLYTPLLREDLPVHPYEAGTWGPSQAERLTVPIGSACLL